MASVLVGTLIGLDYSAVKKQMQSENSMTQTENTSNESKSNDPSSVNAAPKTRQHKRE